MNRDVLRILAERPGDAAAIRAVHLAAFAQRNEADLVDALRDSGEAVLSMVAEDEGRIVGHVLFSRLTIHVDDGQTVPAVALAPMAVAPERQRQGIGSTLLTEALRECRARGFPVATVMSGGYAEDINDTVEIHCNTIRTAKAVFNAVQDSEFKVQSSRFKV